MTAEGYHVQLAKSGREVLDSVCRQKPIDLLILDLDLPDSNELAVLEEVVSRTPALPVVVHTFLSEYAEHPSVLERAAFVEKKGSSVERLKEVVFDLLRKSETKD